MNERLYDVVANRSLESCSTQLINPKKAPASASQTKFGHLNIERTEEPTDKHAKQLTTVSAENLKEDLDDSIMSSKYVRVYKNRTLADMHHTEDISNELKSFPSILFNNSQTNNYKSSEL